METKGLAELRTHFTQREIETLLRTDSAIKILWKEGHYDKMTHVEHYRIAQLKEYGELD